MTDQQDDGSLTRSRQGVRTPGDDVVIRLRVRGANLAQLESGIALGIDALTRDAITLQLIPHQDGVHELEVVTNPAVMLSVAEPVAVEEVTDGW